jgi:hypothetical protein
MNGKEKHCTNKSAPLFTPTTPIISTKKEINVKPFFKKLPIVDSCVSSLKCFIINSMSILIIYRITDYNNLLIAFSICANATEIYR